MAALTLLVFSLLVSTTLATGRNTVAVDKEERPAFQALPVSVQLEAATKKEFYFHVYFNEKTKGADKTTVTVINPNTFAEIRVMDVPLYKTLNNRSEILARAQGSTMQSALDELAWHMSFTIVFQMPQLKDSTLQVMGRLSDETTEREWAIVGGTGEFSLAQGVIYGRMLSPPDSSVWIELKIHGYYTSMTKPPWN